MNDGWIAFRLFKKLATTLNEWGFDVRDYGEYGEFSLSGFVCSYRYFDVLDIDFLAPGQTLQSRGEPDYVFEWTDGWSDLAAAKAGQQPISSLELFNNCVRVINLTAACSYGFDPNVCLIADFPASDRSSFI